MTNTGKLAGDEVVQLYIHDVVSSKVTRPVKELKAFRRVTLQPGETRTVEFILGPNQLSYLEEHMRPFVEKGTFEIQVGPSSAEGQVVMLEVL